MSSLRIAAATFACSIVAVSAPALATTHAATSMYLRVASMKAAPIVAKLDYDAVTAVPTRPNIPASLLASDHIEGDFVLAPHEAVRLNASKLRSASTFTVVQTDDDGDVVSRTTFVGVAIEAIEPVRTAGGIAHRIEFDASSVKVSTPRATT